MGNHNLDDSKIARSVLGYLRGLMGKAFRKATSILSVTLSALARKRLWLCTEIW